MVVVEVVEVPPMEEEEEEEEEEEDRRLLRHTNDNSVDGREMLPWQVVRRLMVQSGW